MKISELITELEKAMAEHGDVPVYHDADGVEVEVDECVWDDMPGIYWYGNSPDPKPAGIVLS